MQEQGYCTLKEAARLLMVVPGTIQRWDREGRIKAERTAGGHRRIPLSEIDRLKGKNTGYDARIDPHAVRGSGGFGISDDTNTESTFISEEEAAEQIGIKVNTVRSWVRNDALTGRQTAKGNYEVEQSSVTKWLLNDSRDEDDSVDRDAENPKIKSYADIDFNEFEGRYPLSTYGSPRR